MIHRFLNIVTDEVSFTDAFADKEPAVNFDTDEGVKPGFLHSEFAISASFGTVNQLSNTGTNLGNFTNSRWDQFDFGILSSYS